MTGKKQISPFKHPFYLDGWEGLGFTLRTVVDVRIGKISWAIRQKPEWWTKFTKPEITSKWRREIKEQDNEASDAEIDYALAELVYYNQIRKTSGSKFQCGPVDQVIFGDNVISDGVKAELRNAVGRLLEYVPEGLKDWHPGSDDKVLDLVHPSLYPLMYGITPVLVTEEEDFKTAPTDRRDQATSDGDGDRPKWDFASPKIDVLIPLAKTLDYVGVTPESTRFVARTVSFSKNFDKVSVEQWGVSERFQWLPSVFNVSKDGRVQIESYINNLHPTHCRDLYRQIACVFEAALPSLNAVLSESLRERLRHEIDPYNMKFDPPEKDFGDDWDAYDDWFETREAIIPPLNPFDFEKAWNERPRVELQGRQLKVIVKLTNIHLTPEKPTYNGGTWHVEGTINEDIVATSLYYYDSENITASSLEFRAAYDDPMYEQGDSTTCRTVYGLEDEDVMSRYVGSVPSVEDRILTFPNLYQHHVAPFELADKSKPGHRKILCFFLVDPTNATTITTARVPPQQASWWCEILGTSGPAQLPPEIIQAVADVAEWPLSLNKAKEIRKELMSERTPPKEPGPGDYSEHPHLRTFSLCEH